MSYSQINQLYTDVFQLTSKRTDELVAPHNVNLYNILLSEAKQQYPTEPVLRALPEIDQRIKYGDFLPLIGQLKQVVHDREAQAALEFLARPREQSDFEKEMDRNW